MFSRKAISSILFTILVVQIFMPIVLFFPVKKFFKKCASIAIEKGRIERMTLSKTDFLRFKLKDENELKIDDAYYDIKSIRAEGDTCVLMVYRDIDETRLFDAIAKLFGKKGGDKKSSTILGFNIFYDFIAVPVIQISSFFEEVKVAYSANDVALCMRAISVISPPPEPTFSIA